MTETAATYTVEQIAETALDDRRDYDLHRLSHHVAFHFASLTQAGVDVESATHLTDGFQEHLLSILIGPRRYDFTGEGLE